MLRRRRGEKEVFKVSCLLVAVVVIVVVDSNEDRDGGDSNGTMGRMIVTMGCDGTEVKQWCDGKSVSGGDRVSIVVVYRQR